MVLIWLAAPGALLWLSILALPWQPWRVREVLDSKAPCQDADLSDLTVLIPARNEAEALPQTLRALSQQGKGLRVMLVDDHSEDETARIAGELLRDGGRVLSASVLPAGWSGKLWALEQARSEATTPLILLLDADIVLAPGLIATLRDQLHAEVEHGRTLGVHAAALFVVAVGRGERDLRRRVLVAAARLVER